MNFRARLLVLIAPIVLAGCGGGSIETGVGSGGSGAPVEPLSVGIGTVTGFGSVIVNGERYDETSAQVFVDERPDRPQAATVAAIRLGSRVELQHRNLVIERATVAPELIGPVSSVTASGFTALGQTVRVNADPAHATVFEGFTELAELAQGATVEVHGPRTPAGELLATRVQLRPAGTAVRLAGTVTMADGRTLAIGGLAVDAWSATVLPADRTLAAGQRVVVWTDVGYTRGALLAKVVRIDTPSFAQNAVVTLDGLVTEFRSSSSFRVGTVSVDAGRAAFIGGSAAELANGRSVRIRGPFVNGVLSAVSVELRPATPTSVQLDGVIADFVDAARPFRVRDALVRVDPQTAYTNGTAANLGIGVRVEVRGALVEGAVQATSVEFEGPRDDGSSTVVAGRIGALAGTAGDGSRTFRIEGLATEVNATPRTSYRNGTAADVTVGREVRVRGRAQGGLFTAEELEFLDNPATPQNVEIEGTAGNVRPESLVVNGQTVQRTATTAYTANGGPATAASLVNGLAVQVLAARSGEVLTALAIDIRAPQAVSTTVRGIVSGRTSADDSEFLVGSQRVSAAEDTQIVPGNRSLADVVNGADVEVVGTLADGVLRATRIRLR